MFLARVRRLHHRVFSMSNDLLYKSLENVNFVIVQLRSIKFG